MKSLIISAIFLIILINLYSQDNWNYQNTFESYSNDSSLTIGADSNNIWQIGIPCKIFFNSAYSEPLAILTDTINLTAYPQQASCKN